MHVAIKNIMKLFPFIRILGWLKVVYGRFTHFAHLFKKILPFPLIDAMKLEGSELPGQMRKIIYRTFDCLSFYNAPRQSCKEGQKMLKLTQCRCTV